MYTVFGHYYKRDNIDCRNILDIYSNESFSMLINKKYVELNYDENLDAIIVMLNPGSAKPYDKNHVNECPFIDNLKLVKSSSDKVMKRIKSLMSRLNWQHVRVINLLDVIEPDSRKLKEKEYSKMMSIFDRSTELDEVVKNKENFVVCAWGVKKASEYMEKAKGFIDMNFDNVLGYLKKGSTYEFYYPKSELWEDYIVKQWAKNKICRFLSKQKNGVSANDIYCKHFKDINVISLDDVLIYLAELRKEVKSGYLKCSPCIKKAKWNIITN